MGAWMKLDRMTSIAVASLISAIALAWPFAPAAISQELEPRP